MEKLCKQMEEKLCKLLSFLTQLPEQLEMIADEIDDPNLRNALSAVAVESAEYARELNAQLKHLGIEPPLPALASLQAELIEKSIQHLPQKKGTEIMSICENCEQFFSGLYSDLISDYLSGTALKNMMNYQLMGIKSAFMRIRFLNSLRFNTN
jgi:hypothetical protein